VPRSPAFAVERGNRIHQRQGFFRVVPVRTGQANRERHALPVADQMTLAPALGSIGGIWTGMIPPHTREWINCPRLPATNQSGHRERANPAGRSGSDPTRPPVANRPGGASTSSPIRTRVPAEACARNAGAKDEDNAGEACASETRGRPPLLADGVESARTVRQDSTTDRRLARGPLPTRAPRGIWSMLLSAVRRRGLLCALT
jgi:hypothetical protein